MTRGIFRAQGPWSEIELIFSMQTRVTCVSDETPLREIVHIISIIFQDIIIMMGFRINIAHQTKENSSFNSFSIDSFKTNF